MPCPKVPFEVGHSITSLTSSRTKYNHNPLFYYISITSHTEHKFFSTIQLKGITIPTTLIFSNLTKAAHRNVTKQPASSPSSTAQLQLANT